MLPQASYTIEAKKWSALIVFALISLPFYIACLLEYEAVTLYFALGTTVICILFLLVLSKVKIYFDNNILRYQTLLFRREIFWKDIVESKAEWQIEGAHSASVNWIFRAKNERFVELRLGFYSRKDMRILAKQLIAKAPQAVISNRIYEFAEGKFPWYIF